MKKSYFLLNCFIVLLTAAAMPACSSDNDDNGGGQQVVSTPEITFLSPNSALEGSAISVNGKYFGSDQTAVTVNFGGKTAEVTSVTSTKINIVVPEQGGEKTVNVSVTVGGKTSNEVSFTYADHVPAITALDPAAGLPGDVVEINGSYFGDDAESVTVKFGETDAVVNSVASEKITVTVPDPEPDTEAAEVMVRVIVEERISNQVSFRYETPSIGSLSAGTGYFGKILDITGHKFNEDISKNTVTFNNVEAEIISAAEDLLQVKIPYVYDEFAVIRVYNDDLSPIPACYAMVMDLIASDSSAIMGADWTTVNHTLGDGIVCKYASMRAFDSNQEIYIMEVPMNNDIEFGIGYVDGALKVTSELCFDNDAFAGINASFFHATGSYDYVRVNGAEVAEGRNIVGDGAINAAFILNGTNEVSFAKVNSNAAAALLEGDNILVAGPILRLGGQTDNIAGSDHNTARHPRSAVGITADDKFLMVAVDGRRDSAAGMSNMEMALLMRFLESTDAMCLDGGGSTTLYMEEYGTNGVVNTPSNTAGAERSVANVIFARFIP